MDEARSTVPRCAEWAYVGGVSSGTDPGGGGLGVHLIILLIDKKVTEGRVPAA